MEKLKKQFLELLDKIDQLSSRERIYLLVTFVFVLGGGWYHFYVTPVEKEYKILVEKKVKLQSEIASMNGLKNEILARRQVNPDEKSENIRKALVAELQTMSSRMEKGQKALVPPEKMAGLLRRFLDRNSGLMLVSLANISSHPLVGGDEDKDKKNVDEHKVVLYRHDIHMELRGSYANTLAYLKALESAPWRIFWDNLEFGVDKYPDATLYLTVYTLSLNAKLVGG
ncbi:MAG: hypothetical protein H7832_13750 [Magnetococcus sp. DMHC-6]